MARSSSGIRGSRIGSGPAGETERGGELAGRSRVAYFCSHGHQSVFSFATEADVPEQWDCPRCGLPAGQDQDNPPEAARSVPFRSHMAYVRERRTPADGAALLAEALTRLRNV